MLELTTVEQRLLSSIVSSPKNLDAKLVYADWLDEHSDPRGDFLRKYAKALESMQPKDFPKPRKIDKSWLSLIAFDAMELTALNSEDPLQWRDEVFDLLEPAILLETKSTPDSKIEIGMSKYGGSPDLPSRFDWPKGEDCDATYNLETTGVQDLAGFLMQINLADLHCSSFVKIGLPKSGTLSFFGYQGDVEFNVDRVGAQCFHFSKRRKLDRATPPKKLSVDNKKLRSKRIHFRECLRPKLDFQSDNQELSELVYRIREPLANRTLYGFRDYQTYDHHLIGINMSGESTFFINVSDDVQKVSLDWVDFGGAIGLWC